MITVEELELHAKYLRGEADGVRLNKAGADLARADLTGAYLAGANLAGAYLTGANLTGANLARADLTGADLAGAYLAGADLTGAYLTGAYLAGANLAGAYLTGANLTGANLARADLTGAYLAGADLTGADLAGAYLAGANLAGAVLAGLLAKQTIVPEDGEFTAFKNVRRSNNERAILTLKIPAEAARLGGLVGRKCRASRALVVRAETKDGATIENETFFSDHNKKFSYEVGKTIEPDGFNDNPTIECSNGIHFFITRREAIEYA